MNLRERCVARLDALANELRDLHPDDLDGEELLTYVREGAAHIERFAKRLAITPSGSRLYDYINELAALGLPQDATDALHDIRLAANLSKHDAGSTLTFDHVRRLVEDARSAVGDIGVSGSAPGSDTPEGSMPPRTFTVLLADYPTGGEVDYEICTLVDDGRTVTLDHFQLRFMDEDAVTAALAASGRLDRNPATESVSRLRSSLQGSSELSGIWQYEGDLRDVVRAFAPYQHSEAVPYLRRANSTAAVRAATAMAVVDLGSPAATVPERVVRELDEHYAVQGSMGEAVAGRLADVVRGAGVVELEGPRFVSKRRFQMAATRAVACDIDLGVAITGDGHVFVDVGAGYIPMP